MMNTISLTQSPILTQSGYLLPLSNPSLSPIEIEASVTVGRAGDNDLILANAHISSRHAVFEKRPFGFYVKDLRSRNGVFVNWTRVMECELTDGALIAIGTQEFRFSLKDPSLGSMDSQESESFSKNQAFQKSLQALPHMAKSELPIFLEGETGTGKEVMAKLIHKLSPRRKGPFVSVNCSALSESLVESELFGHLRGSFTGASSDRLGAFQEARGGTLFLDEIGDLSPNLQPKLLRALENQEIRPIGGDRTVKTDVRVVTATHKSLKSMVETNEFRQDLYFRIHVLSLSIPSLRERVEDIERLAYRFAKEFRVRFSSAAINELEKYDWPGNIRELKNFVAKVSVFHPQILVQPDHLSQLLKGPSVNTPPPPTPQETEPLPVLKELERSMIYERLMANNWNQKKTSLELRMPKSTLHDRIKLYGIKRPDEQQSI